MPATSFLYGLTVRACDLAAAAQAYEQLEPAYRATGLISLRRQRGTLATTDGSGGAVGRVPDEVWGMIRLEMIPAAVTDGRVKVMEELKCRPCYRQELVLCRPQSDNHSPTQVALTLEDFESDMIEGEEIDMAAQIAEWDADRARNEHQLSHVNDDDWVNHSQPGICPHEDNYHRNQIYFAILKKQLESINQLLQLYGLYSPISLGKRPYFTPDPIWLTVTIALYRPTVPTPTLVHDCMSINPPLPVPVDQAYLGLPTDATSRFARFLSDFQVQPQKPWTRTGDPGQAEDQVERVGSVGVPGFLLVCDLSQM